MSARTNVRVNFDKDAIVLLSTYTHALTEDVGERVPKVLAACKLLDGEDESLVTGTDLKEFFTLIKRVPMAVTGVNQKFESANQVINKLLSVIGVEANLSNKKLAQVKEEAILMSEKVRKGRAMELK